MNVARIRSARRAVAVALVAMVAVPLACSSDEAAEVPRPAEGDVAVIDDEQGAVLIEERSPLVIDVRTVEEYTSGHLVGAQNIPVEDPELWDERTAALDPERPTVVYCRTGRRSEIAAQQLVDAGFVEVYDMGGVEDWDDGVLEIES